MKAATECGSEVWLKRDISIHAAREGGDTVAGQVPADYTLFQSTPPVKAATAKAFNLPIQKEISIHAAREGGDTVGCNLVCDVRISIHAAREGGDVSISGMSVPSVKFQSTPPVKAATIAEPWFMPSTSHFNPRRP